MVRSRTLAFLLLLLSRAPVAWGAPAIRYNDPPVVQVKRPALLVRVEELARRSAAALGRPVPAHDARLEEAANLLLPLVPDGRPPPNGLVEEALRLHGIVEPSPHLVVVAFGDGGEAPLLAELEARFPSVLTQGRFRRMGVGVAAPIGLPARTRLLIAFQESHLDLAPIGRQLPAGARAPLDGRLLSPYEKPELFVTNPDGTVARATLAPSGTRFRGAFVCGDTAGRYQVEIIGSDRFGPSVLANFPIYCGVAAPTALGSAEAPERPSTTAADAEERILALLARDRARAGLGTLMVDPRLARVARAHSEEMRDAGFVGHVSPTTGTASDRLRRAGLEVPLVLENVGRAYGPAEAERGFMDSPGHRGNILHAEVERVGVGVALGTGASGSRELFVTQLFTRPAAPFEPARAREQLRGRLDGLRRGAGLGVLAEDRDLDAVAEESARGLAAGTLGEEQAGLPAERAMPRLGDRFRAVRTVVVQAQEAAQLPGSPALLDPSVTHAGVAAAPRGNAVYLVLVLGARRASAR